MEIKVHLYQQVLSLLKQMPRKEAEKIFNALKKEFSSRKKIKPSGNLQQLILNAPTWTDEEYQNFLEARKHFNILRGQ